MFAGFHWTLAKPTVAELDFSILKNSGIQKTIRNKSRKENDYSEGRHTVANEDVQPFKNV
jgi:hypothetical protein